MTKKLERVAALEVQFKGIRADLAEVKADVKVLLAAHNRQKGMAKFAALLWVGLLTLGGVVGGMFMGKSH